MVRIAPPPPLRKPHPIFCDTFRRGDHVVRIFDPTDHGATATGFRYWGPRHRFDHHCVGDFDNPTDDPDCGIYYAALSLCGCLVEAFGDTGIVDFGERHVANVRLTRDLHLLDLRQHGAMRAGANAALSKVAERPFSQAWSRYFYEHEAIYTRVDGMIFYNAHNDDDAIALYERAADALICPADQIMRLDHSLLRPAVVRCSLDHGIDVPP
jgi:hypothetical protein